MGRVNLFDAEQVPGMRGLTSLSAPGPEERLAGVVDVPVIGARSDGKTQFLVHAIRTLGASAPPLDGVEDQLNRDILNVVMNAREPRPDATSLGIVRHYVFRVKPETLLRQLGMAAAPLLLRAGGLMPMTALALFNALLLGAALALLRGGVDTASLAAALGVGVCGGLLAWALARRRFRSLGEVEVVFWDVAGEHAYGDSAGDYYAFLSALVQKRRQTTRRYGFAPILMCNPIALGADAASSPFGRLRQIVPMFAALGPHDARAMIAINRWDVVKKLCGNDVEREEMVGVAPLARSIRTSADAAREALPVVKRDVVRQHCWDAEGGREGDVAFTLLRYEVGLRCELAEQAWAGWASAPDHVRARWGEPESQPARLITYAYEEGPGSFEGEARGTFLRWIGELAFAGEPELTARARDEADDDERGDEPSDLAAQTTPMYAVRPGARPEGTPTAKPRPPGGFGSGGS